MKSEDKEIIQNKIAPLLERGELALLLGAGFSIANTSKNGNKIPSGESLKEQLLEKCGKKAGPKTTLKDAYQFAKDNLIDFDTFFASCFTVHEVFQWQKQIFNYPWTRIYTTNIDNVLNIAHQQAIQSTSISAEFKFFNYSDEGLVSESIGSIPVISIHGTCLKFSEGFVFSTLEYAKQTNRLLDWHNDLASRIISGGVIVIGNQLEESDFDSYIARRKDLYGTQDSPENWLISPNPDEIKSANLRKAGFYVIDATAEDFLTTLFSMASPKSIGDIVLEKLPSLKKAIANRQAMTWFKSAFSLVFEKIESAQKENGILRHFLSGVDPTWYYIVNNAHAETNHGNELTALIAKKMAVNSTGIEILHVIGPSGSGKTTAIRNSLNILSPSYQSMYEFNNEQSMEKDYFRRIVENLNTKAIFIFYSASDFYYAIKEIADRLKDRGNPYCLFILEDRSSDYKKNKTQIAIPSINTSSIEFGNLKHQDATNIAKKIEDFGLKFEKFSEYKIEKRASIILNKEQGFQGDLLSTLFSLTTHENFERKLFEDYESAKDGISRLILNLVAIIHSNGFRVPVNYIAGAIGMDMSLITKTINEDLAGVLITTPESNTLQCRHRIISNYYFKNYISGNGDAATIIALLEFLSRQFTVNDIHLHPLAYRIYRELISFEFLYDQYFNEKTRVNDCENVFNQAQNFYGKDGIFWLHFGRFYRKTKRLSKAIDCFRTGLEFFQSYQTKHSLGLALVEIYIEEGHIENYNEGIQLLENERASRGSSDPYPTATLLQLLTKIIVKYKDNKDAVQRAKECFNYGIKTFPNDDHFNIMARDYMRQTKS
ncbi:SIR2 family protein [Chromobacterium violaceum]|uniref:P-loop NTPase n=1 Tax=Chromobacterium violaceum TaxID=536 RepID=UPI001B339986|nr:SIR2 family protein [Chromobacterium violaceum]MBP4046649.1 SIR2 family protein [Chromobacterium violaceum]